MTTWVTGLVRMLATVPLTQMGDSWTGPPPTPSWGELLKRGLDNLNAPWIVSSAFGGLVIVLILVTFIGEAIREAFDPKKFTTYE